MPLSDKGRVILKWTMGIGLPLMTGFAIYEVFVKKLASGKSRFQTWTKKDGVITDSMGGSTFPSQTTSGGTASVGTPQNTGVFSPPVKTASSSVFPIGIGASGANVIAMQKYANAANTNGFFFSPALVVDGKYGAKTDSALKH